MPPPAEAVACKRIGFKIKELKGDNKHVKRTGIKGQCMRKKKIPWGKGKSEGKDNYDKKKFQGGTVGLEERIFYYGKGMNIKWMTSKEKLLSYVGRKYRMSKAASLDTGIKTLIEYKKPKE
eukprot:jgi/Psemu1/11898/gm1.11898_g